MPKYYVFWEAAYIVQRYSRQLYPLSLCLYWIEEPTAGAYDVPCGYGLV